jgi:hypothetical protein
MTRSIDRADHDAILAAAIKPHAESIVPIVLSADVAVVVHDAHPDVAEHARSLGWDGTAPVFRLEDRTLIQLAAILGQNGDEISRDWFLTPRIGRIYVLFERRTFLVNFDPARGYSIEPGSDQ